MTFVYDFDITAIVFLLIILWRFLSRRQFPLVSNRVYGALLILSFFNLILDILGSVLVTHPETVPLALSYTVNGLYYVLQIFFPGTLTIYILTLVSNRRRVNKILYFLFAIPALIGEIILLAALPAGLIFRISVENGYSYGPLAPITYVCAGFYMLFGVIETAVFRKDLEQDERNSILLLVLFVILAAVIQYTNSSYLVTGVAIGVSLVIMYFTIQDPDKMIDATTGLFNYPAFLVALKADIASRKKFYLIAVDVQGMRRVNTIYGTQEGDRLLKTIGEYLSSVPKTWSFRIGNVRFAVITRSAEAYLETLSVISARELYNWEVSGSRITMTMTTCHIPNTEAIDSTQTALNMIEHAFTAFGRNGGRFELDSRILTEIDREINLENSLRSDLDSKNGFELYYQPVYNVKAGKFLSAEALLRYEHPVFGRVAPGEFVGIAEKSGLAGKLDEMVVEMAFSHIRDGIFGRLGFDHIQINLSGASFAGEEMTNRIIRLKDEIGIDAGFVIFEITETTATLSAETVRVCMERLRDAGFRFAVDDFGTGYANITRVLGLPFSMVKLDRSLLTGSHGVFSDVIRIFDNLSLDIVAEGAETEEEARFLTDSGIAAIQGFYFAKPVSADRLEEEIGKFSRCIGSDAADPMPRP